MKFYDCVALEDATNKIRRYYAIGKDLIAMGSMGMFTDAAFFGAERYGISHYAV